MCIEGYVLHGTISFEDLFEVDHKPEDLRKLRDLESRRMEQRHTRRFSPSKVFRYSYGELATDNLTLCILGCILICLATIQVKLSSRLGIAVKKYSEL